LIADEAEYELIAYLLKEKRLHIRDSPQHLLAVQYGNGKPPSGFYAGYANLGLGGGGATRGWEWSENAEFTHGLQVNSKQLPGFSHRQANQ
jgi:hypothetical protein